MKVLSLFILVVASASSFKSGPYLPSGWKPQGPAFYLPSEVQATPKNPLKDTVVESEASGSDYLREYGPPKIEEVSQDITNQGLPDVITDQPFFVIETKLNEDDAMKSNDDLKEFSVVQSREEVISEIKLTTEFEPITVTESQDTANDESTDRVESLTVSSPIQEKSFEIEIKEEEAEVGLDKVADIEIIEEKVEGIVRETEDASSTIPASVREEEEKMGERIEEEVKSVGGVNNIADALTNLENEIKAKQAQVQNQEVESKTTQDANIPSTLDGAPEGFLEYGPPGFREYGPPKEETTIVALTEKSPEKEVTENETRKRRFSPKFRVSRKSH